MDSATPSTAKTVEKALCVIESFLSSRGELGITEIARNTKVNKSTVQRIVNTLHKYDYLQQEPNGSAYRLGVKFLQISARILDQIDLRRIARPVLEDLRDKTGETVHLMVLYRRMGVYLDAVESHQSTRVVSAVGSSDHLHTSAVGKALLGFLPEHRLEEILRDQPLKAKTARSITDLKAFRNNLSLVRRRGYAVDDEEGERGTRCVGAPIFDHNQSVIASISVAAPAIRLSPQDVPHIATLVIEAAQKISQCIGRSDSIPLPEAAPEITAI